MSIVWRFVKIVLFSSISFALLAYYLNAALSWEVIIKSLTEAPFVGWIILLSAVLVGILSPSPLRLTPQEKKDRAIAMLTKLRKDYFSGSKNEKEKDMIRMAVHVITKDMKDEESLPEHLRSFIALFK